ncbi:hypothetical protein N7F77_RS24865, partial [Escherichia coli]
RPCLLARAAELCNLLSCAIGISGGTVFLSDGSSQPDFIAASEYHQQVILPTLLPQKEEKGLQQPHYFA